MNMLSVEYPFLLQMYCVLFHWNPVFNFCLMQFAFRRAKMSYNNFQESRLEFSDSVNGQHWIFLRKGLDDFRDGFSPSFENMIVYGKKQPVSIILKSSIVKSSYTAPWNKSKKSSKIQVSLSQISPQQQSRRNYIVCIKHCLNQHPKCSIRVWKKASS